MLALERLDGQEIMIPARLTFEQRGGILSCHVGRPKTGDAAHAAWLMHALTHDGTSRKHAAILHQASGSTRLHQSGANGSCVRDSEDSAWRSVKPGTECDLQLGTHVCFGQPSKGAPRYRLVSIPAPAPAPALPAPPAAPPVAAQAAAMPVSVSDDDDVVEVPPPGPPATKRPPSVAAVPTPKRPRMPAVASEAFVTDAGAPRIVIDLSAPDPPSAKKREVIDLDEIDDEKLAREMQASFDAEALEVASSSTSMGVGAGNSAGAEAIDFRALNAARQRRLERARRLSKDGDVDDGADDDLLHEQRRSLEQRCSASAAALKLRVRELRPNPASLPGQALYERFVSAWQRVPDKTLKIVFHATKDGNMESICKSGLDPQRRGAQHGQVGGRGEYFGSEVDVSAPYSGGSRKMLVFAILMDRSGLTSRDQAHPGEIVINKAEHQLPMAIVTFDRAPVAPLQLGPAFVQQVGRWAQQAGMQMPMGFGSGGDTQQFPGAGRTLGGS